MPRSNSSAKESISFSKALRIIITETDLINNNLRRQSTSLRGDWNVLRVRNPGIVVPQITGCMTD
jgi:hypothetical protein